jgi:cytoskeletal protein RodZ
MEDNLNENDAQRLFAELESLKAKNQEMNERLLKLSEESKQKKVLGATLIALLVIYFVLTKLLIDAPSP